MHTGLCLKALLLAAGTAAAGQATAQCFLVYDRQQRLVYQSTDAPFDLSQPLSQGLAAHFPGHHLVITDSAVGCSQIDQRANRPVVLYASDAGSGAQDVPQKAGTVAATPAGVRTTRDGIRLRPEPGARKPL